MTGGFWQRVIDAQMAVPSDRPLPDLTAELVTMLGSVNHVERDEIAHPVLASWIREGVYDDLLVGFGDSICNGLRVALGLAESDSVFRRSFSALVLSDCLARDNDLHLLPPGVVLNWADRGLGWFTRERDLRGWIPGKGWAHGVAHGADLVAALGQSRYLDAQHLMVLLDVIAERLLSPTDRVLVDGEDDRLAHATLQILQRNLVETELLERWVEGLAAGLRRAVHPAQPASSAPGEARNTSNFLRALYAHLAIGVSPAGAQDAFREPPTCRADVLLALHEAIPRFTPWLYSS